jgi:hypothetical protein
MATETANHSATATNHDRLGGRRQCADDYDLIQSSDPFGIWDLPNFATRCNLRTTQRTPVISSQETLSTNQQSTAHTGV